MAEKLMLVQLIRAQMDAGPSRAIHSLSERYRLAPLKKIVCVFTLVIGAGREASRSGHS
jgi:hypothetical protein